MSVLVALAAAWDWMRASFERPPLPITEAERFEDLRFTTNFPTRHSPAAPPKKLRDLDALFPLNGVQKMIPLMPIVTVITGKTTYSVSLAKDPKSLSRAEVAKAIERSARITERCWANRGTNSQAIAFMVTHLRQLLELPDGP